jgi:[ribosomal protein S5]-alanine N-acetyltransferase
MTKNPRRLIKWPVTIRTKHLALRPLRASDCELWLRGSVERKPKQYKYDPGPIDMKKCTKRWFQELYRRHAKLAREDKVYILGIFSKKTGEHLGVTDIATIRRAENQWASLGYFIHNQFWDNGYATEAVKAAVTFAVQKLHYNRLEAAINLDNHRSIALAKAIGMKREGIRQKFFYENNRWVDHVIYVALPRHRRLKPRAPIL